MRAPVQASSAPGVSTTKPDASPTEEMTSQVLANDLEAFLDAIDAKMLPSAIVACAGLPRSQQARNDEGPPAGGSYSAIALISAALSRWDLMERAGDR